MRTFRRLLQGPISLSRRRVWIASTDFKRLLQPVARLASLDEGKGAVIAGAGVLLQQEAYRSTIARKFRERR